MRNHLAFLRFLERVCTRAAAQDREKNIRKAQLVRTVQPFTQGHGEESSRCNSPRIFSVGGVVDVSCNG